MLLGRSWTEPFGEAMTFSMLPGSKLETSLKLRPDRRRQVIEKPKAYRIRKPQDRSQAAGLRLNWTYTLPFFFPEMRKKEKRARSYSSKKHLKVRNPLLNGPRVCKGGNSADS